MHCPVLYANSNGTYLKIPSYLEIFDARWFACSGNGKAVWRHVFKGR